jgi:hypothetical protein
VVVSAAAVALAVTDPFRAPAPASTGPTYHTGTATVKQEPLTSQTQVDAILGLQRARHGHELRRGFARKPASTFDHLWQALSAWRTRLI